MVFDDKVQATQRLEEERTKWRDRFANVPPDWKDKSLPDRLKILARDLDSEIDCNPSLTTRLDATLRHENRMVELRSLAKTPYNPNSESRENDGIDFNMSYVFMKRILLCTLDGNYSRPIQDLKSYQSDWVFSPQTVVDAWKARTLARPKWPDQD